MASYTPCTGSGKNAVNLERRASTADPNGWNRTPARTFGECPECGRAVMSKGLVIVIKVNRHKAQASEPAAPVSPYVADPANPTDEELAAAIKRSLEAGTLIDADDWMARNAEYAQYA